MALNGSLIDSGVRPARERKLGKQRYSAFQVMAQCGAWSSVSDTNPACIQSRLSHLPLGELAKRKRYYMRTYGSRSIDRRLLLRREFRLCPVFVGGS